MLRPAAPPLPLHAGPPRRRVPATPWRQRAGSGPHPAALVMRRSRVFFLPFPGFVCAAVKCHGVASEAVSGTACGSSPAVPEPGPQVELFQPPSKASQLPDRSPKVRTSRCVYDDRRLYSKKKELPCVWQEAVRAALV